MGGWRSLAIRSLIYFLIVFKVGSSIALNSGILAGPVLPFRSFILFPSVFIPVLVIGLITTSLRVLLTVFSVLSIILSTTVTISVIILRAIPIILEAVSLKIISIISSVAALITVIFITIPCIDNAL